MGVLLLVTPLRPWRWGSQGGEAGCFDAVEQKVASARQVFAVLLECKRRAVVTNAVVVGCGVVGGAAMRDGKCCFVFVMMLGEPRRAGSLGGKSCSFFAAKEITGRLRLISTFQAPLQQSAAGAGAGAGTGQWAPSQLPPPACNDRHEPLTRPGSSYLTR